MAGRNENATRPTTASVAEFLAAVPDPMRRADAEALAALMTEATGEQPQMWGSSIVGFGRYHYRYASGREGDYCATGFSPRKANLTVYLMDGFAGREEQLASLGPHTLGQSCLYLKRLSDVDLDVLRGLVADSYRKVVAGTVE